MKTIYTTPDFRIIAFAGEITGGTSGMINAGSGVPSESTAFPEIPPEARPLEIQNLGE